MHLCCQFRLGLLYVGVAAIAVACSGCSAPAAQTSPVVHPAADPRVQQYITHVLPVLQAHCLRCHGGMNRRGGFNMSTRANLMQGGKDGPAVLPGHPEDSLLLKVIQPNLAEDDPKRMPPKGERLTAEERAALHQWVIDGAVMDR